MVADNTQMKKGYSKKGGFTLIEILMVTALLSVIGLSLFSVFNSGISVWQRLTQEVIAEDVNLFFEKISSDLQSTFLFSEISFQGKEDEISFPVILSASSKSDDAKVLWPPVLSGIKPHSPRWHLSHAASENCRHTARIAVHDRLHATR